MKKFLLRTYDIFLATALIVLISTFALITANKLGMLQICYLTGTSNSPTFSSNTLALSISKEPERFDFVVINKETYKGGGLYKRLIGMPGDTLEIVEGILYVNGEQIDEPYARYLSEEKKLTYNCQKIVLGPNEYYVLGDNRNLSWDSEEFGAITTEMVDGVIVWSYDLRNTKLGEILKN